MILKGSQRGGGVNLAVHLMRTDDNEHARVHELRGFAGETLKEAFQEAEAVSRATKCRQYLFSLSLNPPERERVDAQTFTQTIDLIENRLGLTGQPRAVVFHEKEGRRHAHCVWSRIDAETMTAKPLPFFKNRLKEVSRDLYLDHGWTMPRGMIDAAARDPGNFTLAEWQQAKRAGTDPRWTKAVIQDCWTGSDSGKLWKAPCNRGASGWPRATGGASWCSITPGRCIPCPGSLTLKPRRFAPGWATAAISRASRRPKR
jgi:hypothetical protein